MENKDIEKYKQELLQIGTRLNDFGTEFALHAHNKKNPLPDIFKVTEGIFEIPFKAGGQEQLKDCLSELTKVDGAGDLKTLEKNVTNLIYSWQAKLKEIKQ